MLAFARCVSLMFWQPRRSDVLQSRATFIARFTIVPISEEMSRVPGGVRFGQIVVSFAVGAGDLARQCIKRIFYAKSRHGG